MPARRPGLLASVAIMMRSVGVSPETEQLACEMFGAEQVPDALEVLGWYDDEPADEVHRAVLALSKGDLDVLLGLVGTAVRAFGDVLLWASLPEPTPEERKEARARVDALIRESGEARHRCLVARFGVTGAEQIERSNQNLFGLPRRPQGHADSAGAGAG